LQLEKDTMAKRQRKVTDAFAPSTKVAKLDEEDATDRIQWTTRGSLFIGRWREPLHSHDKIAAFDFDGTLAGVQGAYVYPKNGNDWVWKHYLVPKVIAQLHSKGWRIVILSNQKGILDEGNKSRLRKAAFMGRIKNVIEGIEKETGLHIPVQIYASTGDDVYRKPRRGMWDAMLKDLASHEIDISKSFYVGDAAGRPQSWVRGHKEGIFVLCS
jgi:bifunctional polynucleotide phosphatase/kinase